MTSGTCRFCSCQEHTPCEGGCSWADDARTICTQCEYAAAVARELVKILGVLATNPKAAIRLTTAKWELLEHASQQALVMTVRATVEGIRGAVAEMMTADAIDAVVELNAIAGFMFEHCPEELAGEGEQLSDVVRRLLTPHVGKRVVLAGGR